MTDIKFSYNSQEIFGNLTTTAGMYVCMYVCFNKRYRHFTLHDVQTFNLISQNEINRS